MAEALSSRARSRCWAECHQGAAVADGLDGDEAMSGRARFLADEVTDAFRVVIAGALALAVVFSAIVIGFLGVAAPAGSTASHAVTLSNDLHAAMLDAQSSVRAYVVTGDESVLSSYRSASIEVAGDERA